MLARKKKANRASPPVVAEPTQLKKKGRNTDVEKAGEALRQEGKMKNVADLFGLRRPTAGAAPSHVPTPTLRWPGGIFLRP